MSRLLSIAILCALGAALWFWPRVVVFGGVGLVILALLMAASFLAGVYCEQQRCLEAQAKAAEELSKALMRLRVFAHPLNYERAAAPADSVKVRGN